VSNDTDRRVASRATLTVALINPVGAGLAHYSKSLDHVLRACGISTRRLDVVEPSSADYGRVRWLLHYVSRVRERVRLERPDGIIATWPAVGYWDVAILSLLGGRRPTCLVMHDPEPLVYARGYGRLAKAVARRQSQGAILAHSPSATRAIVASRMPRVSEVLHPMMAPHTAPSPTGAERNVRVLGQYKTDRDIAGLERLAATAAPEWRLEIVGRGWPAIAGWHIRDEFVAEECFDELVRTSHAVLIPYSRFYQSGVAIRALEWNVPVVGPYDSSLQIALGEDCEWLVRNGDWHAGVAAALEEERDRVSWRAQNLYDRTIRDWSRVLDEVPLVRRP
jgi:hypothetical protein